MVFTTNFVPVIFYEVRESDVGSTIAHIAERFKVRPEQIEREHHGAGPLEHKEMLVINVN